MAVISNDIDNEIERHLRNYKDYKKQLEEQRQEIIDSTSKPEEGSRSSQSVSDITALKAQKLAQLSETYTGKWVDIIESFINAKRYPEDWIRILYYGYFQDQGYVYVCQKMNLGSEKSYYELRGKVLATIYTMALEREIDFCTNLSLF